MLLYDIEDRGLVRHKRVRARKTKIQRVQRIVNSDSSLLASEIASTWSFEWRYGLTTPCRGWEKFLSLQFFVGRLDDFVE